ncbi:PREDICTED: serine palmitoyltransferase 2 [Dinoponera quadriceps]|uniref:serine C-palmitoyltransferase n=1 Tax=Dinoponera quadriceps TaxID=609295 RepID=A0A6P3WUQ6_DINQU|nr:PREDICTED: serine palmitoyltransferase 2 [Dinoponera quadriceps]XP_014469800.1 PREDICTED: serine palmitoyltransferase 2 [Dinoponera quadriceps]
MATATTRLRATETRGEEAPIIEKKDPTTTLSSRNGLTSSRDAEDAGRMNGYTLSNTHTHFLHNPTETKLQKKYGMAKPRSKESAEKVSFITAALTHLGFYILMFLGFINQLFFVPKVAREKDREGYAPLYEDFEKFYFRYVYRRVRDCWNRPICSVPGAMVTLKDRVSHDYGWTFQFTGTETECINLGSYNYLGFATKTGKTVIESIGALRKLGCATYSTRLELGTMPIHDELEKLTAKFMGVEDAIVFGMGFATNALTLPSLVGKGCLVLSDAKNHASLILGLRLSSGAVVRVFKHNSVKHLEECLKRAVVFGQPQTGAPWKKIVIIIEGIYSMEGSIPYLPKIVELKKKYKAYLYLDEAHSTGSMGKRGRGICDYYNVNPCDVDILMGTYTKSFGSAGGYIAGTKALIDHLKIYCHAHTYGSAMAPPVAQQIITAMRIVMGEDGTNEGEKRIEQLARNTRYFRRRLNQIGVIIYGNEDSPVVPMLVYLFSKIGAVVRTLTARKIASVGVGFPATPIMEGKIRFCLSAAHTKEQLDYVLSHIEDIADTLGLRYSRKPRTTTKIEYYSDSETE